MSPITTIIHWIFHKNNPIQLNDEFQYDYHNNPIIPDDNFLWIDINDVQHTMYQRDGMPPLVYYGENTINYLW